MERYKSVICLMLSVIINSVVAAKEPVTMREEADAFLASLPDGLQGTQRDAVEAALSGDFEKLMRVRSSRNVAPEIPDAVVTHDMTDPVRGRQMRLFAPRIVDGSVDRLPLLVYFHGGGWTFGSINSCARFCGSLAATGKVAVLAVDYSLAPENPFPAGLNDCDSAVDYAIAHAAEFGSAPDMVSIGGDSSGGNLAIATAIRRNQHQKEPVRSLVLFYPVVVAENDGSSSWRKYGSGFGLDADLMDMFNMAYLSGSGMKSSALVSPLKATDEELAGLPPVLMVSAERDILADQGAEFASRLTGCRREVLEGSVHLFITVRGQETAFSRSVEMTAAFLCH